MSNRSENGQFDIVAQAEAVVEAYIERYFSFETAGQKKPERKKRSKTIKPDKIERRLAAVAIAGCVLLAGLVTIVLRFF